MAVFGGSRGISAGHISPEAAEGGPIAFLQEGDIITIDLDARSINVHLTDAELAERAREWQPPEPKIKGGWLARYTKQVTSANTGAVLKA